MPGSPVILFDGVCNLCNSAVRFVIERDKRKTFRFASLQSNAGIALAAKFGIISGDTDSFLLVDNNKIYKASSAAIRVFHHLPWYWRWMQLFRIIPESMRDAIYHFVAKRRYKWFGKRNACMIPDASLRERFLE